MAQQNGVTRQDYERAEHFLPAYTDSLVHNVISGARWLDDGRLLYRDEVTGGARFMIANPGSGQKNPAFDHEKLAASLSKLRNETYRPMELPFRAVSFTDGGQTIMFSIQGTTYNCDLKDYSCAERENDSTVPSRDEFLSPDGTKAVFIKDYNLWMRDIKTGKLTQLTHDGQENYGYGTNNAGWIKRDKPVLRWSPNSKRIATFQQDSRGVKKMYLTSTNVGHPNLKEWKYPMPGDSLIFRIERVIINLDPKPHVVRLKMNPDPQRSTITDHIADWDGTFLDTEWGPDSNKLAFVSSSRNHKKATLRIANPETGEVRTILNEEVKTFFESGNDMVNWHVLPKSNEAIWFSERSDWGHLYLYDLQTGKLKHQITTGDWNVLQVRYIDRKNRKIYFTGSCREEGDPYFHYFYSIDFSGKNLKLLTPEKANHNITVSGGGKYFVDTYSTPTTPPASVIRNMQGKEMVMLEKADISDLKALSWQPPVPFSVKARDGKTDLYGLMYKPTNFDESKSYPVLNYVYPGPQTGSVGSRSFEASRRDKQAVAELGFIVVEVDAMGTPGRSKSFHEFYYGDMGDNGIPDQIATIKELAQSRPWMDLDNVGIWGHSGGGFASTRAILAYPDFYKVAVSEAGNHDNRNYEDDWGEKWQGLLKDHGDSTNYDNQANELLAKNLKGKLLLAHGTMDTNVPPTNTMLMVNALIKANKDFDLLMLPNRSHGFYMEPYMMRRRWDYFVRNLKHMDPPKEFDLNVK
jgi:dipeptidyl aminopeptidase/acylaminoacyl peptidase